MRLVLALLLVSAGCAAKSATGGGGTRTGVMPMLSELPGDATKRDAILDSSNQVAGPEHRKGFTRKERKAESAAATAAAILGSAFSTTQNVTIGGATTFDEVEIIAPETVQPGPGPNPDAAPPAPGNEETKPTGPLVPWIKLDQPQPK